MDENDEHPVWEVYDLYRTARLNVKFYTVKLARLHSYNLLLELTLAVAAPTSAVAGLWFWNTPTGAVVWKSLAVVSAIVAVIKPVLSLGKKIGNYQKILVGYRRLEHDLGLIKELIIQQRSYDNRLKAEFLKAYESKGKLSVEEPVLMRVTRLRRRCQEQVNMELPKEKFYIPPDD